MHTARPRLLSALLSAHVLLALFIACSVPVAAQRQFDELRKRALPQPRIALTALVRGDFDGDGDLDLIAGNGGRDQFWANDGTGNFVDETAGRMPAGGARTNAIAVGDVDGDGDLDLVLGVDDDVNRLYVNDGTGIFTYASTALPAIADATRSVVLSDLDGDGDLDLLVGNYTYVPLIINRLCLNDGTGVFTEAPAGSLPREVTRTSVIAVGDVDGDGDLDFVCGNGQHTYPGEQNQLYLNLGGGRFADAPTGSLPQRRDSTRSLDFDDVDGDGDLDLVVGNHWQSDFLLLNDGAGRFVDAPPGQFPVGSGVTEDIALVDVEGDGDLDVVVATTGAERLFVNDGSGVFTEVTASRMPPLGWRTSTVADGDFDNDGDVDLVFGNTDSAAVLCLNDGAGTFTDMSAVRFPNHGQASDLAVGDVDGDGDLDVVTCGQRYLLYVNQGASTFAEESAQRLPASTEPTTCVALGDVDGDGDLDLVAGTTSYPLGRSQNRLYLNDGTGHFTDVTTQRMPVVADGTAAVLLGDVDGDGDLDLVVGNTERAGYSTPGGQQNRLYLNDGTGTFVDGTATRMPQRLDTTAALALGDVDGDGDLDLLVGNGIDTIVTTGQNALYLNDGAGSFTDVTATHLPVTSGDNTVVVAFDDIDRDGDLDVVTGEFVVCPGLTSCSGGQNRVYVNDGTGRFSDATAARLAMRDTGTRSLYVVDIDEDGDRDLVFDDFGSIQIHLNDGTGHYADDTVARFGASNQGYSMSAFAMADLDEDTDLDLLTVGPESRLFFNLRHHVHVPFVPRIGHDFVVEAFARQGPAGTVDVAVPFVSAGHASIPLPPLGVWGLDPAAMVQLPVVTIPQPGGVGTVQVGIPNDPGLVGVTVYTQALLVQAPLAPLLSNVTSEQVVR